MSKYQLMPPLTAAEYEQLRQDIQENGVLVAVIEDEDGNVLDGHNREAIADELGIDVPREMVEGYTESEKRKLVYNLNLHRRHLSKSQRNELMQRMRKEGATLQECADAAGVSVMTAQRRTEPVLSNDKTEPEKVTGKDGKSYPARKPRKPPEPQAVTTTNHSVEYGSDWNSNECESTDTPDSPSPVRSKPKNGKALIKTAKSRFQHVLNKASSLADELKALANEDAGTFINAATIKKQIASIKSALSDATLSRECPKCNDRGCMFCKHTGAVPERVYKELV